VNVDQVLYYWRGPEHTHCRPSEISLSLRFLIPNRVCDVRQEFSDALGMCPFANCNSASSACRLFFFHQVLARLRSACHTHTHSVHLPFVSTSTRIRKEIDQTCLLRPVASETVRSAVRHQMLILIALVFSIIKTLNHRVNAKPPDPRQHHGRL
jgi:hypothetical protein